MRNVDAGLSELETELDEVSGVTQETQEEPTFAMPSKFAGKSAEEIVQSYVELEKELGRKGNEIGELRKLTDSFIQRELGTKSTDPKTEELESSFDFDNPEYSVDRRVEENPKLKSLEQRLLEAERKTAIKEFETKHPDYREVTSSPEFQEWVGKSKYRTSMYVQANNNFDLEAGDDLLTMWKDTHKSAVSDEEKAASAQRRAQALGKAATAKTTSGETGGKKILRRADLLKLQIEDPVRYKQLAPEIRLAYAEGRVR